MTEKAYNAVTLNWAARFLGVSVRTVQRLIAEQKFTVYRPSKRRVSIDFHSLKAYRAGTAQSDRTRQDTPTR